MAGRKLLVISNPFVYHLDGVEHNVLLDDDASIDMRVEDIIVGCVRSFHADKKQRQEYVNWVKVLSTYRSVNVLTRQSVQDYLRCGRSTAERYVRVMRMCNPLLIRVLKDTDFKLRGYVDLTRDQVKAGYLELLK